MDYTAEEIKLVTFCVNNIECRRADCPAQESCQEQNKPCQTILAKMQSALELSAKDKEVVLFFFQEESHNQLWKRGSCTPKGKEEECPNVSLCDQRANKGQKFICEELLDKLGCYSIRQQEVLEREIQKIVINNLGNIDWEVGEEVRYYTHEPPTPVGRPDILLEGKESKTLFVVELKPSLANHNDVGQLQKYVGWYKMNLPTQFKTVRGILLAKEFDEGAKYAILANPTLDPRLFELHIEVRKCEW